VILGQANLFPVGEGGDDVVKSGPKVVYKLAENYSRAQFAGLGFDENWAPARIWVEIGAQHAGVTIFEALESFSFQVSRRSRAR